MRSRRDAPLFVCASAWLDMQASAHEEMTVLETLEAVRDLMAAAMEDQNHDGKRRSHYRTS